MQDIKRFKSLNFFSLVCIFLLLYSPFTYGQTKADTIETGIRSSTLDNGMRYLIHSNKAWEGQTVSMNLYVNTGYELEAEGQTNLSHYMEHLPFSLFREEATARRGAVLEGIRNGTLPLQAHTGARYTVYNYIFKKVGSEIYKAELDFIRRMIGGSLNLDTSILKSEHGSFYQEYIYRGSSKYYTNNCMLSTLSNVYPSPILPEHYYEHVKGFDREIVSSFYKDWYHPQRATLVMVGPISDLDRAAQDMESYFGKLKATPAKKLVYPQMEYLQRPNQFIQLEQLETDELEVSETEMYLYWRNQIPPKDEPKALKQKWMYEMLYALIEDHLRRIPTTYERHYSFGIDTGKRLPGLGLYLNTFPGRERETVVEIAKALNQLKQEGISETLYRKQRQSELNAVERWDTNNLGAVLKTYQDRMLNEESLEFDQQTLKKKWLDGLTYAKLNTALKDFLKAGPQDIGIMAPKGAAVLDLSEAQFRNWLQGFEDSKQAHEVHETTLISDSLIARSPRVTSKDLGTDALGGKLIQLANGARVVLYPQEGAPLKLHGFRNVGASNLNKEDYIKAQLVPEWVHISGAGAYTHFEMQRMLIDLGMIYGRALYVNQGESGLKLQAPAQRLEALLQLAHLYLSAPREDPEAFRYWKDDESLFYKKPPYGREEHDLTVSSKEELHVPDAGITAMERYEGVQQSNSAEVKLIHQKLFQHPQEFLFVLSGDFKETEVVPLLEAYLGNLPVSENQINRKENAIHTLPKGPLKKAFAIPGIFSTDLRLKIQYTYPIAREDWKSQVDLKLIQQVIKSRLWELRNVKKRGLYVLSSIAYIDPVGETGNLVIGLPTVAEMEDVLIKDVAELIAEFKKHTFTEEELQGIKANVYYQDITGKSVLDQGYLYHKWNLLTPDKKEVQAYLDSITPKDLQRLLQENLVDKHRYIFMGTGKAKQFE
ncbi:M16 family metallopeptidase [Leeuwenhoekiella marinoflava]|uniref:M16 family metallopeptidase n=1 Tax=Leeuwenhoekiella marinoflava TaxID=988 RepID=UPI003003768D